MRDTIRLPLVCALLGLACRTQDALPTAQLRLPKFPPVVNSVMYRGGRPTEEWLRALDSLGVRAALDLEREILEKEPGAVKQERELVRALGMRFLQLPLHPVFAPSAVELDSVVAVLSDSANWPIFVHYDQGVDRTGIVVAAYRVSVQGWSPKRAFREWEAHGFHDVLLFWWKRTFFDYTTRVRNGSGTSFRG